MVSVSDELVANLTTKLKTIGCWSSTVFVFASDNGGDPTVGGNHPLKGGKSTLFEGGVRSATFVYSELLPPAVRGTNISHMTHISDW
jgi:arylsulfatase A-like enzyme